MKPKAIICDLDGTLCDTKWREHFVTGEKKNWKAFYSGIHSDNLRHEVWAQVLEEISLGAVVVFVTGRSFEYESQTQVWLLRHIGYSTMLGKNLFMRYMGDHRPDTEVKKELFEKVMERYDVVVAFEDRPHIIEMIKELGIRVIGV